MLTPERINNKYQDKDRERFWSKIKETETCWFYTGSLSSNGYGNFWLDGNYSTHFFAYRDQVGAVTKGKELRHICGNRDCVRPNHLKEGTHKENQEDMVLAGRSQKNEKNNNARVTDYEVIEIKDLRDRGKTLTEIAERFNISVQQVHNIITLKQRRT